VSPLTPSPSLVEQTEVWARHARQWARVGPPLRPSADDEVLLSRVVETWPRNRAHTVLLLGVTPEVAHAPWPSRTRLVAIDHSFAMIKAIWAGAATNPAFAVCADWRSLPVAKGACDLIVGDGSLNVFARGAEHHALARALREAIAPDGRLVLRLFVRPDRAEPVETVIADLVAGRIRSFHAFKWRLAMAVHGDHGDGVRLADIWRAWHDAVPDPAALADRLGWSRDVVGTIDAYRDSPTRYTFPTHAEIAAALAPLFKEIERLVPPYEIGDRCPSFIFAPR